MEKGIVIKSLHEREKSWCDRWIAFYGEGIMLTKEQQIAEDRAIRANYKKSPHLKLKKILNKINKLLEIKG